MKICICLQFQCPECHEMFTKNIDFMDHIKQHIGEEKSTDENKVLCRYCLKTFVSTVALDEHLASVHPMQTKDTRGSFKCIICRVSSNFLLEFSQMSMSMKIKNKK